MSFTQADLDRLDAAIASGVLETRTAEGQTVKYNTMGDMLRARALIAQKLATESPLRRAPFITPEFTRGT